jgi:hypothetical protein
MNIPEHDRRVIKSTLELSPSEVGTLTRAVLSCLDSVDALKDEGYRAMLLTLRDKLLKLADAWGGLPKTPEMD